MNVENVCITSTSIREVVCWGTWTSVMLKSEVLSTQINIQDMMQLDYGSSLLKANNLADLITGILFDVSGNYGDIHGNCRE